MRLCSASTKRAVSSAKEQRRSMATMSARGFMTSSTRRAWKARAWVTSSPVAAVGGSGVWAWASAGGARDPSKGGEQTRRRSLQMVRQRLALLLGLADADAVGERDVAQEALRILRAREGQHIGRPV